MTLANRYLPSLRDIHAPEFSRTDAPDTQTGWLCP